MTAFRRIGLVLCLTLAALATVLARDLFLSASLTFHLRNAFVSRSLSETLALAVWLFPLLFRRRLRDVGTVRMPWTWTVFLILPCLALNLFQYAAPPGDHPWKTAICLIWSGIATGAFEELVFRGYAFRRLPEMQPRLTILVSSLAFAFLHFNQGIPMILFTLWLGIALGIIRLVSGSLGWCILLHGLIDASDNFIPAFYNDLWIPTYSLCAVAAALLTLWRHPKLRAGCLPLAVHSGTIPPEPNAQPTANFPDAAP